MAKARAGSARPGLGPGHVARGRVRTARALPVLSPAKEGNIDLSCRTALPHEYATGSPYFVKAAKVEKTAFKSELYLQVSRNWELFHDSAPGSRRGQRQPGER